MDPWSKVDYSWHIGEASMTMERFPEVNPPSGRVSRQRLLAAPILKWQQRRNREEIRRKGSLPRVSAMGAKYWRKGAARRATRGRGAPWARPRPWPRHQGSWWVTSGPPLGYAGSFWCADFFI